MQEEHQGVKRTVDLGSWFSLTSGDTETSVIANTFTCDHWRLLYLIAKAVTAAIVSYKMWSSLVAMTGIIHGG
jgi:hypothetical protein